MLYTHKCLPIADLSLAGWLVVCTLLMLLLPLHTTAYAADMLQPLLAQETTLASLEPQQSAFLAKFPFSPTHRTLPDTRPDFRPRAETSVQVDLRIPEELSRALQQEDEVSRSAELRVPAALRDYLRLEERVQ